MSKRSATLYLQDIKTSIKRIEEYTKDLSFEKFKKDHLVIDAVVRNLEIIGEAAKNIPAETRAKYPKVPWKEAIGIRNKVTHEYFGIDLEILWKTIKEDLQELKGRIKTIHALKPKNLTQIMKEQRG